MPDGLWLLQPTLRAFVGRACANGIGEYCNRENVPRARPDQWLKEFSFVHHVGSLVARVSSIPGHARRPHKRKNPRTLAHPLAGRLETLHIITFLVAVKLTA